MRLMVSQTISLTIVYLTTYLSTDQRKHQGSTSLPFVWGIHWWPVNSPHKWPVTRKKFPFDDVIIWWIHTFNYVLLFLAATKQLYEWFSPFVCPSVLLSVTPFWLCSHHRIIMKFSGGITNDRKVKVRGQRSRSQGSTPNLAVSGP